MYSDASLALRFAHRQLNLAVMDYEVERLDCALVRVNEGLLGFRIEDPGNLHTQHQIVTGPDHSEF